MTPRGPCVLSLPLVTSSAFTPLVTLFSAVSFFDIYLYMAPHTAPPSFIPLQFYCNQMCLCLLFGFVKVSCILAYTCARTLRSFVYALACADQGALQAYNILGPDKSRTEKCIKYVSDTHFDGQEARMLKVPVSHVQVILLMSATYALMVSYLCNVFFMWLPTHIYLGCLFTLCRPRLLSFCVRTFIFPLPFRPILLSCCRLRSDWICAGVRCLPTPPDLLKPGKLSAA